MSRFEECRGPHRAHYVHGLYRDRENGWLFGVCAGIAERFGFSTLAVRIVALLSLFLFFLPTLFVYAAAVVLIRERPLIYAGGRREEEFWRCRGRDRDWSAS